MRKVTAPKRKDPYKDMEISGCYKLAGWFFRIGLLLMVLTICLTASLFLYARWLNSNVGGVTIEGGGTNLNPIERLYLQTYLASRAEQLQQPAGVGTTAVPFSITSGQHADTIAANLVQAGLLTDTELFLNYLRYFDLDSRLEAGEFFLDPTQPIPELAIALTNARARNLSLRFIEGWRLEEMAHYLQQTRPANIDPNEFLAISQRRQTYDFSRYDFLSSLPPDASLEGFLFPDTYQVPLEADAAYLIDLMLTNFGNQITPEMRQVYGSQGLSLRQAHCRRFPQPPESGDDAPG